MSKGYDYREGDTFSGVTIGGESEKRGTTFFFYSINS